MHFGQLARVYVSALFPAAEVPQYLKGVGTYTGLWVFCTFVSLVGYFFRRKFPY